MTRPRYEDVKRVFHGAVELDRDARAAFVESECLSDHDLRREVEDLLRHHDEAGGFLEEAPPATRPAKDESRAVTRETLRFASYRVVRTLGRGGMGVVYLAEQDGTRRTVALKVVRAGLATSAALERFAFEAQILGRLNHRGIAQIYEAGTADTGLGLQPYFAMEFVDGAVITHHARSHALSVPQRLALLAQACDAVEHAHVKGVIHRDLKPGNLLVDQAGQVKVLDFGVARATTPVADSGASSVPSRNTEPGQLVGTLPYMSPEQIAGDPDDLDTRSDVYALGVIGYELLADKPAFAVDRLPPLEAARVVKDTEPAPLSSFSRLYRGDIETVVARAMEKDRGRRYQSAAALAGDIRRYLNDEPVEARPASAWYQVTKFARRHRAVVVAFAVVVLAIGAAISGIAVFARREAAARNLADIRALAEIRARADAESALKAAKEERALADRQRAVAEGVTEFLFNVFNAAHNDVWGRDVTLVSAFRHAEDRLNSGAVLEPEVEVAVRRGIGSALNSLGHAAEAESMLRIALDRANAVGASDDPIVLDVLAELADSLQALGKDAEAEVYLKRVVGGRLQRLGPDNELTIVREITLAETLAALQKNEEAEAMFKEAIGAAERNLEPDHPVLILALGGYARMLRSVTRYSEAEPLYRRSLDLARSRFGDDHHRTVNIMNNLAVLLSETHRADEALSILEQVVSFRRRVLGKDDPRTAGSVYSMARLLYDAHRIDDADVCFREVVEARSGQAPTKPAVLAASLCYLGRIARARGMLDDALTYFDRAAQAAAGGLESEKPVEFDALLRSVRCLVDAGRTAEARNRLGSLQRRADSEMPDDRELNIMTLRTCIYVAKASGEAEEVDRFKGLLSGLGATAEEPAE